MAFGGYLNSSHIDPRIFGAHHNTAAENFSLLSLQLPSQLTCGSRTSVNFPPEPSQTPDTSPVSPRTQTPAVAGPQHASLIPQERYTVRGQPEQPLLRIDFFSSDGRQGVPLSRSTDLRDTNKDIILDHRSGKKMSYRILFPGGYKMYGVPKNVTLKTDAYSCRRVLTRAKLVAHIVDLIKEFIKDNSHIVPSENKWKVGEGGITLENLVLISVELVSKGSLQPRFMYIDPSKPW